MREHPIPQDITGYNFHIIGNMTIKQFAEVGVGVGLAFGIFSTNLYPIVKYPLMLLVAGIGAAAAFVPFEDRPLDHWLVVFFKTLYKPTKYFWKREPKIPDVFNYEPTRQQKTQINEVDLTPARRERIREYVTSIKVSRTPQDESDVLFKQQQAQVLSIFDDQSLTQTIEAVRQVQKPNLKIKVRSLGEKTEETQPTQENKETVVFENPTHPQAIVTPQLRTNYEEQSQYQQQAIETHQIATNIDVPELEAIRVENTTQQDQEIRTETQQNEQSNQATYIENKKSAQSLSVNTQATQNKDLPFPTPPTEPNKIVGMILTPNDELIDNALIEINDPDNHTVRAIKSNALGQFFISSPLKDGEYILEVSKPNFVFNPVKITLNNQVVTPIEIRSQ
jgi:hypothetical protein